MNFGVNKGDNLVIQLWNKFFPYWPLFLLLLAITIAGAWTYLQYATPLFEASASILIKDEKKGSDESKLSESLNYLSSKKIVENEIEVLRSKALMKDVVRSLNLYAAVFEEGRLKPKLIYETSPIQIAYQSNDTITQTKKIYFSYNDRSGEVVIEGKRFPCNEWVYTKFGVLQFTPKPKYKKTDLPLFFTLTNPKNVVNEFTGKLDIAAVSKLSSVVRLSIIDESPERAEDVLKGVLASYNKELSDEKNSLATNTSAFVDIRLKAIKQDLDSIERKIQEYKSGKGALDISSQGRLFLENVSSNDQRLSDIDIQLAVLTNVKSYLLAKNNTGGTVPSTLGVNDPLLSQLLNKLYDAELQYEKLKKTTAENNPILVAVTDEIKKIKPSILENIESQQKSLLASRNNLSSTNGSYSNIMQSIPQKERELIDISREHTIKSSIYNFLLQRREEAALSFSSNTLNNKVIDEPEASTAPVSPNEKLIYLLGIICGLGLGVSIILGKELINRKILYRSEIENLTSFPVIGEISFEKTSNPLVIANGKRDLVAEQFRKLRASISSLGINSHQKTILITSTISGDGKSFVAANLGLAFAMSGMKVILVELDLSNPSLSEKLSINAEKGASNFLTGESYPEDIIRETDANSNLFIIPAGTLPENPSELLMNGKVKELLSYLEERYDYIIIDTAPVTALSDAYILSPLCDSTLYIVRHNHTPKADIQRLDETNKINKLKNVTILFNSVQQRGYSKNGYGYGYSYGYANKSMAAKSRFLSKF